MMNETPHEAVRPTDQEIRRVIESKAQEIAEKEDSGAPGQTRISLRVVKHPDGSVTGTLKSCSDRAKPYPALNENEVELTHIADSHDWVDESHREWWLSGEGVEDDGIEYFDHRREGPADARTS